MPQRVLISGASVAGPALAYWLCRYGYRVTVIERAAAIRPGGYAVDFRGSGMRALERMGLAEQVRQYATRTGAITIVDEHNRVEARLPDGFTSGELEIQRGAFVDMLYRATRDDAEYIFSDSISAVTQAEGGVDVTMASGRVGHYDIVVGADGLHSNVRSIVFGDEQQFVRHMGYYIAIYTVPDFLGLGDAGRYFVRLRRRVGCFGTPNTGMATASFYFASGQLDYDRRDVAAQKQLLRDTFAGMTWEAPRMLAMLDEAPDFYFDSLSQVSMESWSKGRVVLLGDACACASPMAGMGTSIAMVGAYVLAGELKAAGNDHGAAFAAYQAIMRPFVQEAQKLAGSASWFIPRTRLKLWLSKKLWSWMPEPKLRELMIEEPNKVASLVALKEYG